MSPVHSRVSGSPQIFAGPETGFLQTYPVSVAQLMTTTSEIDRLLYGSPLKRPRNAVLTLGSMGVIIVAALYWLFSDLGRVDRADLLIFSKALAISTLLSLVPLAVLWALDRREREAAWLFVLAFVWGGLIATGLSVRLNAVVPALAIPVVEELAKGAGIILLFFILRAEFDNMRDGFIYGALVGAGFTWMETAIYVMNAAITAEPGTPPALIFAHQFGVRFVLLGLSSHALYSGMFGMALGWTRRLTQRRQKIAVPIGGMALAILAHSINNALLTPPTLVESIPPQLASRLPSATTWSAVWRTLWLAWSGATLRALLIFLPFVGLTLLLLWLSGKWEVGVIKEELQDEAEAIVTPTEYGLIERDSVWHTHRLDKADKKRSRQIIRAQNELAFRKRRVRSDGDNPDNDVLVSEWRSEIVRLRAQAAG
ncbi:MAG: PrsW family intramembrane metalloprotease [Anaerolineae bacterium]|nr:PrsW family intramembrane metalloprotease [Anaerolineae bacterium]